MIKKSQLLSKIKQSPLDKLKSELIKACQKYLDEKNIDEIKRAIEFAETAHEGQERKSGEVYLIHSLETAKNLTELRLDSKTIIAGILHDCVEDTECTLADLKKDFGSEVASLVDGVTKLSHVRIKKGWFPLNNVETVKLEQFERQVETLRKMLIASAKDVRVVLIKLADKIHNMQTLAYLDKEKQERIAREVLEIFAPIAQRLGIGFWQGELEDLAFPFVSESEYKWLDKLAIPAIAKREKYLKQVVHKLNKYLREEGIEAKVECRAKRKYSLYKKLLKYEKDMSKIYDLIAVRIITDSVGDCYKVMGVLHSVWKPLPGRIKDFIALPKPNGYKSIHTTVFCEQGQIVEFQIRNKEMDSQAKFGIASHWVYSQSKASRLPKSRELKWIRDFYKIQKTIGQSSDLADSFAMDLFSDRIFAFTPQGDVKDLPREATPVDFAYYVHTWLGNHCAGAKVNDKMVSFETKLSNGDIVEIITKNNAKPRQDWLKFVKTNLAKNQIKKYSKVEAKN